MSRLRLGPLVEDKPVKLMVELPGAVHRDLVAYASAHAAETGTATSPERLIPAMVAQFMAGDRAFAKVRRAPGGATPGRQTAQ